MSVEGLLAIDEALKEFNEIVGELAEGKIGYFDALKRVHGIIEKLHGLTGKDRELYEGLVKAEEDLAFNALLLEGASPSEVRKYMTDDAWSALEDDIPKIAETRIVKLLASGDVEGARRVYKEYSSLLPDDAKRELDVLTSRGFNELIDAIQEGDENAIIKALRRAEREGLYDEYRAVLKKYYGLNLDEVKAEAYRNAVYEILGSAETPEEALAKLRAARDLVESAGLESLINDLDRAIVAVKAASRGDLEGMVDAALGIRDKGVMYYAVSKGILVLMDKHPEALAEAGDAVLGQLAGLARNAGLELDVGNLVSIAKGAAVVARLDDLLRRGAAREALKLWLSLPSAEKEAVSLVTGVSLEDLEGALREYASLEETIEKYSKQIVDIAGKIVEGDYINAYQEWSRLDPKARSAAAKVLGSTVDKLGSMLALAAGLQAVAALENPTLDKVKETLTAYVGEELAERIAREWAADAPLARVVKAADAGDYEGALREALKIQDQEERTLAVQYVLASLAEREGSEALAEFMSKHKDDLAGVVPSEYLSAAELAANATTVAEDLYEVLREVLGEAVAEKIKVVVDEFDEAVKAGDFKRAAELVKANKELLESAGTAIGVPLVEIMQATITLASAGSFIEDAVKRIEEAERRLTEQNLDPAEAGEAAREAAMVAAEAESRLHLVEGLNDIDDDVKERFARALAEVAARAYADAALLYLASGDVEKAANTASKAASLDTAYSNLYRYMRVAVEVVKDPANLAENVACIAQSILVEAPGTVEGRIRAT